MVSGKKRPKLYSAQLEHLHKSRENLDQLERHHPAVDEPHHRRALLNPELPQPRSHALRLEPRRAVLLVRVGCCNCFSS